MNKKILAIFLALVIIAAIGGTIAYESVPTKATSVNTVITSVTVLGYYYGKGNGGAYGSTYTTDNQSETIPQIILMNVGNTDTLIINFTDYQTSNPKIIPKIAGLDDSISGTNGVLSFAQPNNSTTSTSVPSATRTGTSISVTWGVQAMAVGTSKPLLTILPSTHGYSFQNATCSFQFTVTN